MSEFISRSATPKSSCFVLLTALLASVPASAGPWGESETVLRGRDKVVTYRAKVENGWLIVEVRHEKDWHTYSMDNVLRARAKSGKERPDTELPTRIVLDSGLEAAGDWYQSEPKDLSTPAIKWYTWGFENVSQFAVPVKLTAEKTARVVVNAQACNASSCSMVQDLVLDVPVADAAREQPISKAPADLIPVQKENTSAAAGD